MKKTNICFIGANPNFDGGIAIFQKNLIKYIKDAKKTYEMTWIYPGSRDMKYSKDGVNYVELKSPKILFLEDIYFNRNVLNFLKNNNFDIINSHAIWGHWMKNYEKNPNQKIVHTYHGSAYYFLKNNLKRFGFFKRIIFFPLLLFGYYIEKPPMERANSIICVSEKVKRQIEELYFKRKDIEVIRTGVDLKNFKPLGKEKAKRLLNLNVKNSYGLYIGRGGYWTKGLDRAINISEEMYKKDKNYRLMIIGAEYEKVKKIISNKKSLIFLENIPREKIPLYYSASDIFFCLSRYEGGAPTLVTSEAMASGCLLICSKDSEQEIIENNKNGLIVDSFDGHSAERIMQTLKNKQKKDNLVKNSIKTIRSLSLGNWGGRYLRVLR